MEIMLPQAKEQLNARRRWKALFPVPCFGLRLLASRTVRDFSREQCAVLTLVADTTGSRMVLIMGLSCFLIGLPRLWCLGFGGANRCA